MIKTVDLRVDYGDVHAVRDVNLAIPAGEIFGLIGPNGAGKTSTIKVLATLQEPTYGEVFVGGIDVAEAPQEVHKILGYMPDFPPVYDDLKVWEFLDLFASAYFVPGQRKSARIDECIQTANLEQKRQAMCGTLSRGMRQRLILAKTLLHEPKVLLLDEPASGLDPMARIELRNMLKTLTGQGKTVLVSSHILTELSDFCSSIGIMETGRMVVQGKIDDIIKQMTPHMTIQIELLREHPQAVSAIEAHPACESLSVEATRITVVFGGTLEEAAQLLASLVEQKVPVVSFYEQKMDVEDVFMKVGAGEVA